MRTHRAAATSLEEETVSGSRGTHKQDPATTRLAGWITPRQLRRLRAGGAGRHPRRPASVVRVVVDRDEGVPLDDIAEVSRAVSDVLAPRRRHGPRDVLEVTSPGSTGR